MLQIFHTKPEREGGQQHNVVTAILLLANTLIKIRGGILKSLNRLGTDKLVGVGLVTHPIDRICPWYLTIMFNDVLRLYELGFSFDHYPIWFLELGFSVLVSHFNDLGVRLLHYS